ncbi:MAG: Bro-N domain-containing protein [Bacteroidetes bacterium]|nr:Bro-N domain-containing protein [Bacteroidota bacterium]
MKDSVSLFDGHQIRRLYDEKTETWYFSVVDILQVLIQQPDYQTARKYWNKLKERLKNEGSESVTNCHRLQLEAADGKKYYTDVATAETLLRLIQSVPSPKAEPIKRWLAKVGYERMQEMAGLSIQEHKQVKGLKTQNLRDHMSEAELIFTALAELSTRQIAESMNATGLPENKVAGKKGGGIAKKARLELESKTGKSVISGQNYLPPNKKGPPKKPENEE